MRIEKATQITDAKIQFVSLVDKAANKARLLITKSEDPLGTDIRLNDKVVDLENGYAYIAEVPRVIRGHHISVYLHRTGAQGVL